MDNIKIYTSEKYKNQCIKFELGDYIKKICQGALLFYLKKKYSYFCLLVLFDSIY